MIYIGDTALQERVEIPVFHTGVFGQTGVGKTKLLKHMLPQAQAEGFGVLILDSKLTEPEFTGVGEELPFYLEQTTDPDIFRSLIEGMRTKGKGNMERFRGGFIEVCDGTKNFEEIGKRLENKLGSEKIRGYTRAMYSEIRYDFNRLMQLIGKFEFADEIVMVPGQVYRMETRRLPNLALQGLVVKSVVDYLLSGGFSKLIILVDEAPNFVPQTEFSPAKSALQRLDSQGRSVNIFGWYSGQTLTGFDKRNMKNLWYWIIGREMENNEARDAWKTQTSKVLKQDDFRKLKPREFVAISPEFTKQIMVPLVDEVLSAKKIDELAMRQALSEYRKEEDWSDVDKRVQEVEAKLIG